MKGEGHCAYAKPIDPAVLAEQILGSNSIEGDAPSGELSQLLQSRAAAKALDELTMPPSLFNAFQSKS